MKLGREKFQESYRRHRGTTTDIKYLGASAEPAGGPSFKMLLINTDTTKSGTKSNPDDLDHAGLFNLFGPKKEEIGIAIHPFRLPLTPPKGMTLMDYEEALAEHAFLA